LAYVTNVIHFTPASKSSSIQPVALTNSNNVWLKPKKPSNALRSSRRFKEPRKTVSAFQLTLGSRSVLFGSGVQGFILPFDFDLIDVRAVFLFSHGLNFLDPLFNQSTHQPANQILFYGFRPIYHTIQETVRRS
jgi:hypothetical protein